MIPLSYDHFEKRLGELADTFGPKHFGKKRQVRYWKQAKQLERYQFDRLIDLFLDTYRTAPLPKDFQTAVESQTRYKAERSPQTTLEICPRCNGIGFLRYKAADAPEIAIRCPCEVGDKAGRLFPPIPKASPQNPSVEAWDASLFIPERSDGSKVTDLIYQKAMWWRGVIQISQGYWRQRLAESRGVK